MKHGFFTEGNPPRRVNCGKEGLRGSPFAADTAASTPSLPSVRILVPVFLFSLAISAFAVEAVTVDKDGHALALKSGKDLDLRAGSTIGGIAIGTGGGAGESNIWGGIGGNILNQGDLVAALDLKLSAVTGNKTVYVDASHGSDVTGLRERLDKPFATIGAARTAASSGDTVVVFPGSYTGADLFKTGVNYHFADGAIVTHDGLSAAAIFDDYTGHVESYVNCKISGAGEFNGLDKPVLIVRSNEHFEPHGSNVVFQARKMISTGIVIQVRALTVNVQSELIKSTGGSAQAAVLYQRGNFYLHADEIESAGSATIFVDVNDDEMQVPDNVVMHAEAGTIRNTGTGTGKRAINFKSLVSQGPQSSIYITADRISADSVAIESNASSAADSLWRVRAHEVIGQIKQAGGKLYVECPAIIPFRSDAVTVSGGEATIIGSTFLEPSATIGSPSNGQTLPQSAIYTSTTARFPTSGSINVTTGNGVQTVAYTGINYQTSQFTGCSGGSGTMSTGGPIAILSSIKHLAQTGGTLTVLGSRYDTAKTSGTITNGDPRVANSLQTDNNLSDVAAAATAFSNIAGFGRTDVARLSIANNFGSTVQATGYKSSDGSAGETATTGGLTIKNGLVTAGTISGTGPLFAQTHNVAVGGTTTQTTLVDPSGTGTPTLPIGFFVVGKSIRVTARGVYGAGTGLPTATLRLKLGSITYSMAIETPGGFAAEGSRLWKLDSVITCRSTGVSGTVFQQGDASSWPSGSTNFVPMVSTTTGTVDTTATNLVDVTWQWSSNNAGHIATCTNLTIEAL